jgi:RND family efflux transporter MFP subunit
MLMKASKKVLIWLVVLAVLCYGGYRILQSGNAQKESSDESMLAESAPVKVAVERVRRGDIKNVVWVTGEVRPLVSVEIVPKIAGRLERLRLSDNTLIEEGVRVKKDEVVAVIEHAQLDAAKRSAEAALLVAQASYETAKVNLADAQREKDRWTKLRQQGSGTEQQLDMAVTAYERAQTQLKQAEAQIEQAQAMLEQAKVNLEDATIESPISGVVSLKYVDEGAFVNPSSPLFKVVDISEVEITGGVADRHYPKLAVGKTAAEVEVDAYPGETFNGSVTRVRPELDKVTRTVAVTIRVSNEALKLKPGMYARIKLILDERKNVLLVSDDALMNSQGQQQVFVVNDGIIHRRPVKIGLEESVNNEVIEGLALGDIVVVKGQQLLREGMKVEAQLVPLGAGAREVDSK